MVKVTYAIALVGNDKDTNEETQVEVAWPRNQKQVDEWVKKFDTKKNRNRGLKIKIIKRQRKV